MDGTVTRAFLAAAAAAAVTLAWVQVATLDSPTRQRTSYTWDSALDEVRTDVRMTVERLRLERDQRLAMFDQMARDMRTLDETLAGGNPQGFGR